MPATGRSIEQLREAIDGLAPIVGVGLTSRLIDGVAEHGADRLTAREALSVLTAQLTLLTWLDAPRPIA